MLKTVIQPRERQFLAKIALEMDGPGRLTARVVAQGGGWSVSDVLCTCGPRDRPFEERRSDVHISIVAAGTFQYRSNAVAGAGRELMTPGSLMLGNAGRCFECSHEHGTGDRCLSFGYTPEFFEQIAADAGIRGKPGFRILRLPPLRAMTPLVARACSGLVRPDVRWEELTVKLAARAVQLAGGFSPSNGVPPGAVARVTKAVRNIERHPDAGLTLGSLAREAGLSPYHFLRTFERLTGVTPHQYILRARLREAAMRLADKPAKVLDIALDCGFGDVSNFNRAFRAEFGMSPRVYRRQVGR